MLLLLLPLPSDDGVDRCWISIRCFDGGVIDVVDSSNDRLFGEKSSDYIQLRCKIKYDLEFRKRWTLTPDMPLSEMPEPDMLSARRRSLSGSPNTRDWSDLFLRMDLERRWCSRLGDASSDSFEIEELLFSYVRPTYHVMIFT